MSTDNKFYSLPKDKSTDAMSNGIYVKSASSSNGLNELEQSKGMLTENLEQQVSKMKNGDTVFRIKSLKKKIM